MSGKYQHLYSNDQQMNINEKLKLEQFKSIFISTGNVIEKLDCNQNELRTLTFSKLIIQLDEDIRFKLNPDINLTYTNQHPKGLKIAAHESAKEIPFNCSKNFIKGFDDACKTVNFTFELETELCKFLPYLDGKHTICNIADHLSTSEKEVLHLLQPLYEIGFLVLCSKSLVPALTFYTHLMNTERDYRVKSLQNPYVNNHDDLEYLKDVLIQNLFALYHYVSAFPEHLGEAISHISNPELKEKLCNVLTGNYWHRNMLLKGLMELGYSKEQIKQRTPLPATLGIINYLRWLAKTDLLSYAACLGLTEYPAVSEETAHTISNYILAEWDSIELLNLLPKEVLEYFRKYKKIDYMKARISKDFFDAETYLTPERQAEIQSRVRVFIECQKAEVLAITQYSQVMAA
ncbi:MAG: hypothetical protein BGO76_00320 [Caedibacter sp. 38-128]|nr:hypothetical protein [Holosporales bacterium]OJX05029.1 MAG: hypothetical protein BGO76_00320 [Caedibacter sp. 38-128]